MAGKITTSKSKLWEVLNSLWILWAVLTVGFLNYISFFYIAYKVKQKKWTIAGIIYALPFIAFMIISEIVSENHWLYNLVLAIFFIAWFISIFHAFKVRSEYLLRLEAYKSVKNKDIEKMRKNIASEYGTNTTINAEMETKENNKNPIDEPNIKKESHVPIDINTATEEEIGAVPNIGVILAKKVVSIRHEIGMFLSIEHFGEMVGLKPHILERIRPYIKVVLKEDQESSEQNGRVVDI